MQEGHQSFLIGYLLALGGLAQSVALFVTVPIDPGSNPGSVTKFATNAEIA